MVKVSIDQKECIGCEFCMSVFPELFKLNTDIFKSKLIKGEGLLDSVEVELSEDEMKKLKEVVENCPIRAVKFSEQ